MIRKIVGCVSLFLACHSVAWAASFPFDDNTATSNSNPALDHWNGFYLGAGLGYVSGNIDTNLTSNVPEVPSLAVSKSLSAANPMGVLGYAHTFSRFYLAGELDFGGFVTDGIENTSHFGTGNAGTSYVSASPTWSVTPSVLVGGLLTPQWLLYGRAGVNMMGMNSIQSVNAGVGYAVSHTAFDTFNSGMLWGLGLSYSVTPRASVRAEYDYSHISGPSSTQTYFNTGISTSSSADMSYNEALVSFTYLL